MTEIKFNLIKHLRPSVFKKEERRSISFNEDIYNVYEHS